SPVARRVAHVATTAKGNSAAHRSAAAGTQRTATHGSGFATRVHHRAGTTVSTHHQATTTPRTTTPRGHRTQPARHTSRHTGRGGPLHSKSYPVNTSSGTS